jgi:lysophospholipase L1-like esterase
MNHRSQLRAVVLRTTALCLGVLAACGLAEAVARGLSVRSGQLDPHLFSPNEPTVYANRPGFEGDYAGAHVHINRMGFRGREPSHESESIRVLLLGDSVAFGQGVEEGSTIAAVAERRFEVVLGEKCEVLNAGVPGFNTVNEAARLEQVGRAVHPDLVVVLYTDNDTDPQLFTGFRGAYPITADGHYQTETDLLRRSSSFLYRHSALYNQLRWSIARLRSGAPGGIDLNGYREAMGPMFSETNAGFRQSMSALGRIKDWCDAHQAALLVAVWSRLAKGSSDPYASAVLTHLEVLGIRGELLAPVGPDDDPAQLTIPFDGHPNALAHTRMAEQLVESVAAHGLLRPSRGDS